MSQFSQQNFKFGAAKLQASNKSLLSLTSNDGGEMLVQSATSGDYISVALGPGGLNQECFNGTAIVNGQQNQSLLSNTLYSVYLRNLDGNEYNCKLEFWETFKGHNPIIEGNGLYVANTGGVNIGLMYLGQVFTQNNDISTLIFASAHLKQCVYSHFNPWKLGFQTDVIPTTLNENASGRQVAPTILTVTEGIADAQDISASINFYGTHSQVLISFCIEVNGTAIDEKGGSQHWMLRSPLQYLTIANANCWYQLNANFMSAPPIGVYTVYPIINYKGPGSITCHTQILGKLSY